MLSTFFTQVILDNIVLEFREWIILHMKRPSPPVQLRSLWTDFSAALAIALQSVPSQSVMDQQLLSQCLGPILTCQVNL